MPASRELLAAGPNQARPSAPPGTADDSPSHRQLPERPDVSAARVGLEVLLAVTGVLLYFAVRGLMAQSAPDAIEHAGTIASFEQALRFYWEPAWQGLIVDHQPLVTLANWAYIYLHWPVIALVGVWLFFRHPREYFRYRSAFLISGAIGLALFVSFPVAPPRLAGIGLADTVTAHSNAYRVLQPPAFVNQYAAFPSLHFGWNLLIGLAIFENARAVAVKAIGAALPLVMLFAIVATANHFLIDAIAGGAISLAALAAARWLDNHSPIWRRLGMTSG